MISFSKRLKTYLLLLLVAISTIIVGIIIPIALKVRSYRKKKSNNLSINRKMPSDTSQQLSQQKKAKNHKKDQLINTKKLAKKVLILGVEGDFFKDLQEYKKAVKKYKKALAIISTMPKREKTIEDAYLFSNLGFSLIALNQLEEAFVTLEKALAIFDKIPDAPVYPRLKIYKNGLGFINIKRKQLDKALANFSKSIELEGRLPIPAHHDVAEIYTSIAYIYQLKKKLPLAIKYYQYALATYAKQDIINYEAIVDLHTSLGLIYQKQGHVADAVQSFRKAILLQENAVDDSVPNTNYLPYLHLGRLYRKEGYYSQGLIFAEKAFNIIRHKKLNIDRILLPFYKEMALFYYDAKYLPQAIFQLERYIALTKARTTPMGNAANLILLGDIYTDLRNPLNAYSCYSEAYKLVKPIKKQHKKLTKKIKTKIRIAKILQSGFIEFPPQYNRHQYQHLLSMSYTGDNLYVILSCLAFFAYAIFAITFLENSNRRTALKSTLIGLAAWYLVGLIRVTVKRTSGIIHLTTQHIAFPENLISQRGMLLKVLLFCYNFIILPYLFVFADYPSHTEISYQKIKKIYFRKKYIETSSGEIVPIFIVKVAIKSQGKMKTVSFSTLNVPYRKLANFINIIDMLGIPYTISG